MYVAHAPFRDAAVALELVSTGDNAAWIFDADGEGAPEIATGYYAYPNGDDVSVMRPDGDVVATFLEWFYPIPDLDGDGFDDVWVHEELASTGRQRVYAGPFEGRFRPETHSQLLSWESPVTAHALPDLDGDGRGELGMPFEGDYVLFREKWGTLGEFVPAADARLVIPQTAAHVAIDGSFGGDSPRDLALLPYGFPDPADQALSIFVDPLY